MDNKILLDICLAIASRGGRALLVGGCVRDQLLGKRLDEIKDFDLEVFGLSYDEIASTLGANGQFELEHVGQSFGVLKIKGLNVDISIPRQEVATGVEHTSFDISLNPNLTIAEAAQRRDFTINAIYYDPITCQHIDPMAGIEDLHSKILKPCSSRFVEDHLRVLRAAQFMARFGFIASTSLLDMARTMTQEHLSKERLFEEWSKLLLRGIDIKTGLEFLKQVGWIKRFYPELYNLIGCKQTPAHHPEGDVWEHTTYCLNHFASKRTGNESEDLQIGFSILCHDMGKPATSRKDGDKITSYNHETVGVPYALSFLNRLTNRHDLLTEVPRYVASHMAPYSFAKNKASDEAVFKLATKVDSLRKLLRVVDSDQHGRPPRLPNRELLDYWNTRATHLGVMDQPLTPIVLGRHFVAEGFPEGPSYKHMIEFAYKMQMRGAFRDEASAILWIRSNTGNIRSYAKEKLKDK